MLPIVANLWRKELLLLRRVPKSFLWSFASTFLGGVTLSIFAYAVIFAPTPAPAARKLATEGLAHADQRLVARLHEAGFDLTEHDGDLRADVANGRLSAGLRVPRGFGLPEEQGGARELRLFVNRGASRPFTRASEERLRVALASYNEESVVATEAASGPSVGVAFRELGSEAQRLGTLMALVCTLLMGSMMASGASGTRTVTRVTINELEHNTIEALLVTPSSKAQILAGKLAAVFSMSLAGAPLVLLGYWASVNFMGGVLGLDVGSLRASLPILAGALPLALALTLVVNVLFVSIAFCLGRRKQLAMILGVVGLVLYGLIVWSFNSPPDNRRAYLVPFYGLAVLVQGTAAGAAPTAVEIAYALGSGALTAALVFAAAVAWFDRERTAYPR